MIASEILNTTLQAGTMLLESGAEVYRVEDTMVRMAKSFPQVQQAVSYVTVTGIMLSITVDDQTYTKITRVYSVGRNLHQINEINSLSRACKSMELPVKEVQRKLDTFKKEKPYSFWVQNLFGAIGACGFALFFGGNIYDIVAVFFVGLMIRLLEHYLIFLRLNPFFVNLILAMFAAIVTSIIAHFVFKSELDIMLLSSLMLLVPGLALTNAIRDTLSSDYLSGLARLMHVVLVASALALGAGLVLYFL